MRREAETAADDPEGLFHALVDLHGGKRRKRNGTVQLAVLKDKRGALGTTPQQKAELWLEKFVDEFVAERWFLNVSQMQVTCRL